MLSTQSEGTPLTRAEPAHQSRQSALHEFGFGPLRKSQSHGRFGTLLACALMGDTELRNGTFVHG
jgi:hypothetical protein